MDEVIRFSPLTPAFLLITGFLWLVYGVMILWFLKGWISLKDYTAPKLTFSEKVSVIVPCRNEEGHLPHLIRDLLAQDYPSQLTEIILADDHSTDHTREIMSEASRKHSFIKIIQNQNKGKKEALLSAIRECSSDFILTTDADVHLEPRWITTIVSFYEHTGARFIAGPVAMITEKKIISKFQSLEFYSLIGAGTGAASAGHPIYCNGANLAYEKNLLNLAPNPLHKEIESGDDVFLLHTVKKYASGTIRFLKSRDATVRIKGKKNVSTFIRQRIRWASKSPGYKDFDTLFTAWVVLLVNLLIVFFFVAAFFQGRWLVPSLVFLFLKSIPDFLLLFSVTSYFKQRNLLIWFPFLQLIYPFYIVITGLAGIAMYPFRKKAGSWK